MVKKFRHTPHRSPAANLAPATLSYPSADDILAVLREGHRGGPLITCESPAATWGRPLGSLLLYTLRHEASRSSGDL